MALTIDELRNGVNYWRLKKFPPDFHNAFYQHDLVAINANGLFSQAWWERFLPVLKRWKATRNGPADYILTLRAQTRLGALRKTWSVAVAPYLNIDIAGVGWHQIAAFPSLAAEIKDVTSPVFTSKFCHFLAPRIFPVTDNKLLGLPYPTYEGHFTASRAEWLGTASVTQHELISLLTHEVGAPLFGGYPMKCKLIELCMIGRRHGCDAANESTALREGKCHG
jgi:hypothetical protein